MTGFERWKSFRARRLSWRRKDIRDANIVLTETYQPVWSVYRVELLYLSSKKAGSSNSLF